MRNINYYQTNFVILAKRKIILNFFLVFQKFVAWTKTKELAASMQFVIITTGNLRFVNSLDMAVAEATKIILKVSKNVTEHVVELFNCCLIS